jgi:glycogenin glucosyltransferase
LTDYERIIYLDADVLVLKNLDHLFDREFENYISAAPDMFPPDKFQSGVMIVRPNAQIFQDMISALNENRLVSYDQGDQGFLNAYFADWYSWPAANRLEFKYNVLQTIVHAYPPAWKYLHDKRDVHVLHFSGDAAMFDLWGFKSHL